MDEKDKLAHWMKTWDQHAEAFGREQSEEQARRFQQQHQTSFFNDRPATAHWQDREELSDDQGWGDIVKRSQEYDYQGEEMFIDHRQNRGRKLREGEEPISMKGGIRDLTKGASPGSKNVNYQTNPQTPWSIGNDQEDEEGHLRVTNNWSDGKELLELDRIKRDIEQMERKVHEADVTRKGSRTKLESELKGLRQRVRNLSEKIQSRLDIDVT